MMLLWLTHTTGIRVTELALLEVADVLYPSGAHAQLAGVLDVLFRHVRLGAVSGDAHHSCSGFVGRFQVIHRADAW